MNTRRQRRTEVQNAIGGKVLNPDLPPKKAEKANLTKEDFEKTQSDEPKHDKTACM